MASLGSAAGGLAGSIMVRVGADISGLQRGLGKAGGMVSSVARGMVDVANMAENAGRKATMKFTLPIAGGMGIAAKMAGNFEQQLKVLQATVGASGDEMKRAGSLAAQLGRDVSLPAVSATDAAEAMTQLAKGGLSMGDVMDSVRGTLLLATAAQVGNAEAANITANALNAFQLKGNKAVMVADLLAGSAKASTGEITDMAFALQMSATVAHQAGQSIEDTVTAISLMAKAGVQGSDAGTSLKTMFMRLMAPTGDAKDIMKEMGIVTRDAHGEMVPLRSLIEQFSGKLKKMTSAQRDAAMTTLFGTDAIRAANIILGRGTAQYDMMSASVTKQGIAQEQAAARMSGFNGALEKAKSAAQSLGVTVGLMLLPYLTKMLDVVARLIAWVDGLPGPVRTSIVVMMAMTAAMGPLLIVLAKAAKAFAMLKISMLALSMASSAGVPKLKALQIALGLISRIPMAMAVTAGIAAATAAGYALYRSMTDGKTAIELTREALDRQAAAHRNAAAAAREQKGAIDALVGNTLDYQEAQLDLKDAVSQRNRLERDGKKGTDEYARASIAATRAMLRRNEAARQMKDGTAAAAKATEGANKAAREDVDLAKKGRDAALARVQVAQRLGGSQEQVKRALQAAGMAEVDYQKTLGRTSNASKGTSKQITDGQKSIQNTGMKPTKKATNEVVAALGRFNSQELATQDKVAQLQAVESVLASIRAQLDGIDGRSVSATVSVKQQGSTTTGNPFIDNIKKRQGGGGGGDQDADAKVIKDRMTNAVNRTPWKDVWAVIPKELSKALAVLKQPKITDKARESAEKVVERWRRTYIDRLGLLKSSLATKMSNVADFVGRAFADKWEKKTQLHLKPFRDAIDAVDTGLQSTLKGIENDRAALTPAEAMLKGMEDNQAQDRLSRSISDAQKDLAAAYKSKNKDAILAAQRTLQDAQLDQQMYFLQKQAEQERKAADENAANRSDQAETAANTLRTQREEELAAQERFLETQRLAEEKAIENSLAALERKFAQGKITSNQAMKAMKKILDQHGIDFKESGERLGDLFVQGLNSSIGAVGGAAEKLAKQIAKFLKLKSPADKGPLSTIDDWWKPFVPTLVSGLNTDMLANSVHGLSPTSGGMSYGTTGKNVNLTIVLENNTLLGNSRETARELARILDPEIRSIVRLSN